MQKLDKRRSQEAARLTHGPSVALWENAQAMRHTTWYGVCVVAVFVVGSITWAALAPLASAALALGVVAPDGNRRMVQHLEGGIIRSINVTDGDYVRKGDILVEMDRTRDDASVDILRIQMLSALATLSRLKAEEVGRGQIDFPKDVIVAQASKPAVAALVAAQTSQFLSRRAQIAGQKYILNQRSKQNLQRIVGLQQRIESARQQIELLDEELSTSLDLLARGLERKPRVLQLRRAKASLEGDVAKDSADIAEAKQSNEELNAQIRLVDDDFQEKLARERTTVETELSTAIEKLKAVTDIATRTKITSPVDGTIVGSRFHTIGGVIPAGAPVLEIVPGNDKLTVDVRISPADIDVVREGQSALVRFTAYHQRNLPRINGKVTYVAADTTIDEQSGNAFFLGKVDVDPHQLRAFAPSIKLSAGMPAEVAVTTGTRTVLQYALDPILSSIQRSFIEE